EREAAKLFAQLVSGVDYLHKKQIVHRDLKLENLLLDRHRNVIITDFGFANHFTDAQDDLMSTSCGSPCYAAPELVVSDGTYVGSAVDIWSCGVILYAMLCGYLPYDDDPANPDGDNINLLYRYILSTELVFPEYVSEQARDLLRKMLVPDPSKRCEMIDIMIHPWLRDHSALFEKSVQHLEWEGSVGPPNTLSPVTLEAIRQAQLEHHIAAIIKHTQRDQGQHFNPLVADNRSEPAVEDYFPQSRPDSRRMVVDQYHQGNVSARHSMYSGTANSVHETVSDMDEGPMLEAASVMNYITGEREVTGSRSAPDTPVLEVQQMEFMYENAEIPALPEAVQPSQSEDFVTAIGSHPLTPSYRPLSAASNASRNRSVTMHSTTPGTPTLAALARGSTVRDMEISQNEILAHQTRSSPLHTPASEDSLISPNVNLHHNFESPTQPSPRDKIAQMLDVNPQKAMANDTQIEQAWTSQDDEHQPVQERRPSHLRAHPSSDSSHSDKSSRRKAVSLLVGHSDVDERALARAIAQAHQKGGSVRYPPLPVPGKENVPIPPNKLKPSNSEKAGKKSAGKKMMDWLRGKKHVAKDGKGSAPGSSMGIPSNDPQYKLGGKIKSATVRERVRPDVPFTHFQQEYKLRLHHGAVDQAALTSRLPPDVFADIRSTLENMGLEVKCEGEFKLRCVRPKRKTNKAFKSGMHANLTSPSGGPPTSRHGFKSPADAKKRRMTTNGGLKTLLRKTSLTQTSKESLSSASPNMSIDDIRLPEHQTPGTPGGNQILPLYGDPSTDPGDEIRFAVELCKLKNFPNLYVVDLKRLRGNLWAYKFLYHSLLERLDLETRGGYMSTVPSLANMRTEPVPKSSDSDRLVDPDSRL
ncbi:hypothetical protein BZG36_05358, partial [Bifiguratus adelaidae]